MAFPTLTPRDLGNGLALRQATPADVEALVQFNGVTHAEPGEDFSREVAAISREAIGGDHPVLGPAHHLIVEHISSGAIVSSIQYIPQTWTYAGIPFGIGRIEAVGTHPDYRRNGLVRQQFAVAHAWAEELGHLATFVTGIPWYYSLFGYEEAVIYRIRRTLFPAMIPPLPKDAPEPYTIRPATEADIPFIAAVYDAARSRYLLTTDHPDAMWRFDLRKRAPESLAATRMAIIATPEGDAIGWLEYGAQVYQGSLVCASYELQADAAWLAVTPTVMRYLHAEGQALATSAGQTLTRILITGEDHPVYAAFPERITQARPVGWNAYLRVPDLGAFLRHIAPALEERLARSVARGYSGSLTLHWYRDGLKLTFTQGKLTEIDPWQPPRVESGDAAYPNLTFLRRLFGWQSQEELEAAFRDSASRSPETRVLLNILFPKQPSWLRTVQ